MDSSFQPLLDLLSTLDEDLETVLLKSVSWPGMDVQLELVVSLQDQPEQRWRVSGRRIRDSRLRYQPVHRSINDIQVVEGDHPVLLPHSAPVADLYFYGRSSNADAIVGQLVEAHVRIAGNWLGFEEFVNPENVRSPREVLESGGFGLFAKGPQPLIDAYAQVLRQNGISVSSPPSRQPLWWDGERFVDGSEHLSALILGESYFVGAGFTAEKH